MIQKMPMSSGGSSSNNLIFADWENVNQNSYCIYKDTKYTVTGTSASDYALNIPDVLRCEYQNNNNWKMTNLTGKTMRMYYNSTATDITTNTVVKAPDSSTRVYATYIISDT